MDGQGEKEPECSIDRLTVTPAGPEDAGELMTLWIDAFPLKFAHVMGDSALPILREWFEHVPRIFANTYLARVDGVCAGYIQLTDAGGPGMTEGLCALWSAAQRHLGLPHTAICMLRLARGELDRPKPGELCIKMLGVRADFRGRGVGAALLDFAEDQAHSRGLRRLRLGVVSENTGAIRLYERCGFKRGVEHRFLVRWASGSPGYYTMTKDL